MPGLTLGDTVPNLEVETTHGNMKIHDYFNGSWTILFSHPGDFTPTCTTELAKMASYSNEFERRGVELLGLSCDDVGSHKDWTEDIEAFVVTYPIVANPNRLLLKELNMVDPDKDSSRKQMPSRSLHIIGPDKKIRLSFLYPACTGRNIDEVLRVLDSLQRACKHKIATPVNWKPGGSRALMTSRRRSCSPRASRQLICRPRKNTSDSPISTEDDVHSVSFSPSVVGYNSGLSMLD